MEWSVALELSKEIRLVLHVEFLYSKKNVILIGYIKQKNIEHSLFSKFKAFYRECRFEDHRDRR